MRYELVPYQAANGTLRWGVWSYTDGRWSSHIEWFENEAEALASVAASELRDVRDVRERFLAGIVANLGGFAQQLEDYLENSTCESSEDAEFEFRARHLCDEIGNARRRALKKGPGAK